MPSPRQTVSDQAPSSPRPTMDDAPERIDDADAQTILIADDSPFERSVIRSAVEGMTKFRVCGEAGDGVDAVKKARELKPNLVIMDLAMPQMNGVEAATVLKHDAECSSGAVYAVRGANARNDIAGVRSHDHPLQGRRLGSAAGVP